MLRRLDVQISGATEGRLRRWRRTTKTGAWPGLIVAVAIVAAIPILTPFFGEPGVEVGGSLVRGSRVLFIQDTSGSMNAEQAVVDQRTAALGAAGIAARVECEVTNEFADFSDCIDRHADRGDADTLYVFADFEWAWGGRAYTCSPGPADAGEHLFRALQQTGWRIYFETIRCELPRDLAELAENSGGGVIRTGLARKEY
jgi:hypothetical protein